MFRANSTMAHLGEMAIRLASAAALVTSLVSVFSKDIFASGCPVGNSCGGGIICSPYPRCHCNYILDYCYYCAAG